MQPASVISPDSFITMPWKNGLGETIELLKEDAPDGSDFRWRLSMADVTSDGSFSNFTGHDRTLLLLAGNGLELNCSEAGHFNLTEPLQAARFSGDEATHATLAAGPVKDFNVMTARAHCSASVCACVNIERKALAINCDVLLVYALDATLTIRSTTAHYPALPANHLLHMEQPATEQLEFTGATFICVQISRYK